MYTETVWSAANLVPVLLRVDTVREPAPWLYAPDTFTEHEKLYLFGFVGSTTRPELPDQVCCWFKSVIVHLISCG